MRENPSRCIHSSLERHASLICGCISELLRPCICDSAALYPGTPQAYRRHGPGRRRPRIYDIPFSLHHTRPTEDIYHKGSRYRFDGVRKRLDEGPVWVVERKSAIIGTIGATSVSNALVVRGMAVHPTARGLGVAKKLLREVEDFARQNGYKQLSLFTTLFLTQAISMYQSAGFRFTGETANPHGTRLLRMVKALDIEPPIRGPFPK